MARPFADPPKRCRPVLLLSLLTLMAIELPSSGDAQQPEARQARAGVPSAPPLRGPLPAAADEFFTVGDMTIRFRQVGAGDPVIVLHGWSRTLADWSAVTEALAPTHRVIAMDVRGFGKSAKSGDPAKYGSQMADDVIRLMDHLDIRRAHVAGQSMGALIAADVAARYPNRVATVTLISGPFYDAARQDSALVADLVSGRGATRMFEPLLKFMDSATVVAMGEQLVAQNDLPSLIASMRSFGILRHGVAGRAPIVPALVICGTADDLLADSHRVATWWQGSRLVEVAGATHMVLARPEVGAAMIAFMKHE